MKKKINGIIISLLLILLITGCHSTAENSETRAITQSYTPKIPIVSGKPASTSPIRLPTQSPTGDAMQAVPTEIRSLNMQLTFINNNEAGKYGVYAIDILCLEIDPFCLGEPRLLFESTAVINDIAWSPDGKRFVYSSIGMNNEFDLFIADWDGKNIINLTNSFGDEGSPNWSRDGLSLAYIYGSSRDPAQIRILDLDTGKTKRIFDGLLDPFSFIWSPNGNRLAYSTCISESDCRMRITIADAEGIPLKEIPAVSPDDISDGNMSFSNDSQFIVYSAEIAPTFGPDQNNLYVINLNDISEINLVSNMHNSFDPRWSPKGNWIAFTSDQIGNYEIYLINPDGTGLRQITHNPTTDTNPAWRLLP